MTKSPQKVALSASRDIPFNQLVLSQANVRRIKAGVSIEELAEDIARRTLLQSLTVRPVIDAAGGETGLFEIPAGGRRYRALELLVKQKRLARTAPVPCIVRTDGLAEEDSLAENVQRAPLHPLDQFRAFLDLRAKGLSEEEIAARFFVQAAVVKQRLRLAQAAPALLDVYAEDGMSLEQLMAFTVSADHERQVQVWAAVQRGYNREPYQIRRLLTEGAVRASDKRAQYVGQAYVEAGGEVMRDLFQHDEGGWLQDVGLLDRLLAERLERDADAVRAEGWKWVEVALDFPYGHAYGLRQLAGRPVDRSDAEAEAITALRAEAEGLEAEYEASDELPEAADRRLGEIEAALAALEARTVAFEPAERARAGAFVSVDGSGALRVERGFVRPEDEPPAMTASAAQDADDPEAEGDGTASPPPEPVQGEPRQAGGEGEEDESDAVRPLPDRLATELTAHRTLALREALGAHPAIAVLAVLHVLCLKLFYPFGQDSCLEIDARSPAFGGQAPGLADTALAARVEARHAAWRKQLPGEPVELWGVLQALDADSREALFAHCAALTVNGVFEAWNRRPRALAHADRLAEAVGLDMAAAGWTATAVGYLARVPKARILAAVREARGEDAARRIEALKKPEMVEAAEALLCGSGWLPQVLRTPGSRPTGVGETAALACGPAIDPGGGQAETDEHSAATIAIAAE